MELKEIFHDLIRRYDPAQAEPLWTALENAYTGPGRFYHNLAHLQHLYMELHEIKHLVQDWDTLLFTLFYHDVVYEATQKDNEVQSAIYATKVLSNLKYPAAKTERCNAQIRATQYHEAVADADTNLFTDADLSILGKDSADYARYAEQVRQEYAIYPDELYKPGRQKVLLHFLAYEMIYKTNHFQEKYENQARINLKNELHMLE